MSTNADRIRAMSKAELKKFGKSCFMNFLSLEDERDKIRHMSDKELLETLYFGCPPISVCKGGCKRCWENWLGQEVSEDG